jgi:hypothetical protein
MLFRAMHRNGERGPGAYLADRAPNPRKKILNGFSQGESADLFIKNKGLHAVKKTS